MPPFIKRFKADDCHYVYDSNTNEIVKVDPVVWDVLGLYGLVDEQQIVQELAGSYPGQTINRALAGIRRSRRKEGLFSSKRPEIMRAGFTRDSLQEQLESAVSHLVLCMTEMCNLRCGYCVYSGEYEYFRRHGAINMDVSIACQAVDFFNQHSSKEENPSIGFYGGEPLLRFGEIKKVTKYVRKTFKRPVLLLVTTNGTNLTPEVIHFLIEEGFQVQVSLDGPRMIHDRFRRYPKGGGSFEDIYRNLKCFRELDEKYFLEKMFFQVTMAPSAQISAVYEFFKNDPVVKDANITFAGVAPAAKTFFDQFTEEEMRSIGDGGYGGLQKAFLNELIAKGQSDDRLLTAIFERPLFNIHRRNLFHGHSSECGITGLCYPGVRRLFVKPDGVLLICERVADSLTIGNLKDGYDIGRIWELLEAYSRPLDKICTDCWAVRLCSRCFAETFSESGYDEQAKIEACETTREEELNNLINYCKVLSKNPKAFDYMNDMEVT
jgi:uncharacterized protein